MAMISVSSKQFEWRTTLIFILLFWLSGSVVLDTVIMPIFYASGMMTAPEFATTSYSIFWFFNRIEVLCAALILSGSLALNCITSNTDQSCRVQALLSAGLFAIALIYTYGLTPQMSTLGMNLNLFNPALEPPVLMNQLHVSYWLLELSKLVAGGFLLRLLYQQSMQTH
jgi:hypothetical protein